MLARLLPVLLPAYGAVATQPPLVEGARAKIPDQSVEVSLEAPGFTPVQGSSAGAIQLPLSAIGEDVPDPRSQLFFGSIQQDVWLSFSWAENFPSGGGEAHVKSLKRPQVCTAFAVEKTACLEMRIQERGICMQTLFEAFPETADFRFRIVVVVENVTADDLLSGRKNVEKFSRESFAGLVRSLKTTGDADRSKLGLPPEAYAFKDEAAAAGADAAGWVRKQVAARPDDWVPSLYLGLAARTEDRADAAAPPLARALELLEARKDRDPKTEFALALTAEAGAWAQFRKKNFAAVIPLAQRVLGIARSHSDDRLRLRPLEAEAAFSLACAYAQTQQGSKAIESLRTALDRRPEWKSRASLEESMKPLRSLKEFRELVGK